MITFFSFIEELWAHRVHKDETDILEGLTRLREEIKIQIT